ncbi:hypothetical protein L484_026793 [Morus notabilis]|uniref:Pyridine nucleotide-disulfide oxidoreductase domain-containing protein 2 n=1 Tax=Morus notabilis TaxID=981085 RepID=W9SKU9_9ROSA|nr:hypothetical protein L484_026793 [Morus notabilis]
MWRRCFSSSSGSSGSSSDAASALKDRKWDALVIGGGHNGLTAAAYLARAGISIAVLERRHVIGGAAAPEETIPGFQELELGRHGLKMLKRNPSSFTPCLDGRYLLLGPDKDLNYSEISKFSKRDADAYPRYENQLENFCKFMDPLIDSPPPESLQYISSFSDRFKDRIHKSVFWDFMDLLLSPASKVLNNWFETDVLKATLATDAVIGSTASVHTPGSGYVLLHHVMGETHGDRGIWSYVEGGMGAVSLAIGNAAKEAGACIITRAEVKQLLVEDSGRVNGVLLADGTLVRSSIVLSNATPYKTFKELTPNEVLPDDFLRAIKYSDYSSGTTKINLAVDKLPQFQCCKLSHLDAGPQHMGTIHIGSERFTFSDLIVTIDHMEEIHSACQDSVNGLPSRRPVIEMTIPSVLDKTISPPGKHVINLFIQYTPYKPSDGNWMDPVYRESFANRCFSLIDEYAPGFSSSVIGYDMLTPPDLEREIGLTGGNIFHGAMGLDSLFLMRPVQGWSSYRTPLRGLYLCGSGAHPGGGVMGAPGRNAALTVLQDIKKV